MVENTPYMKIYQVSCGFRNTFFLVENRKIYYTGYMESSLEQNTPTFFNTIEKVIFLKTLKNIYVKIYGFNILLITVARAEK